ncbi:MAG: formyltransferase family protein [Alphaproteobacteria bacterium]
MILLRNKKWASQIGPGCSTLQELREQPLDGEVLVAFATGVIVPKDVLDRVRVAYNFHPASPQYPGRDPHHWAIYEKADSFGATCHIMTERVDEGPIVRVVRFPVLPGTRPHQLCRMAEQAAFSLYRELSPTLLDGSAAPNGEAWCGVKRTRSDFNKICELHPDINESEFRLRYFSFSSPGYKNLFTRIYNIKFYTD